MRVIKTLLLGFISAFLCACSGNESKPEDRPISRMDTNQVNPNPPVQVLQGVSKEFKSAIDSLLHAGYTLSKPDTFQVCNSSSLFSLTDPYSVFNETDMMYLGQSNARVASLYTPGKKYIIHFEEWVFPSKMEAHTIMEELGKPLPDKTKERFKINPFTFWDYNDRIDHIYTDNEEGRAFMDEASAVIAYFQGADVNE
jgi:hypothetical protein